MSARMQAAQRLRPTEGRAGNEAAAPQAGPPKTGFLWVYPPLSLGKLDFIINYAIKYRMGGELEGE
jgi:hypothetical protein